VKRLGWIDVASYLVYLAFLALVVLDGPRDTIWYVGLCLSAACAVLWFLARLQLGDAFSVTAEARRLVTRGLYSKLRHPIYLFGTLAFLFAVLALLGWRALITWLVVVPIQTLRAKREDRILAEAFGAGYTAYHSKTWF
jgi:protein-S-isoprenylcysteine O-methyltransferase Ste14